MSADERAEQRISTPTSRRDLPSLDEAERVASFVLHEQLHEQLKPIAAGVVECEPTAASVREIIALPIAAVTIAERLYRLIGKPYPAQ